MKKRIHLEQHFNEHLQDQELMVKFRGENEFVIIGAPTNNLITRIVFCILGISLVSLILINGFNPFTDYHNAFVIGGSLTGLVMASSPFVSFYSKKNFRMNFSRKLRRITIEKGISPDKRIDFSNIDELLVEQYKDDDFVTEHDIIYNTSYFFSAKNSKQQLELFILYSSKESFQTFVDEFSEFLSSFTGKDVTFISH